MELKAEARTSGLILQADIIPDVVIKEKTNLIMGKGILMQKRKHAGMPLGLLPHMLGNYIHHVLISKCNIKIELVFSRTTYTKIIYEGWQSTQPVIAKGNIMEEESNEY